MYCSGLSSIERDYFSVINMKFFVEGFHKRLTSTPNICNAHKLL